MPQALSQGELRLVAMAAQGIGVSRSGTESVGVVVRDSGFIRTLGGMDVYLALRARISNLTLAEVSAAVDRGEIQISPTVRGCIYLVAREHAGVSLRIADMLSRKRQIADQAKAGIKSGEVEALAKKVVAVLSKHGPQTTDGVRKLLPDGAIRSLGEAGKKVGVSSTLPPSLRHAEFEGLIERTVLDGRLDTERYLWRVPKRSVFEDTDVPKDDAAIHRVLAEIFLRSAGVGGPREFGAWSGLSQRDAKAAMGSLDAVEVEAEGREAGQVMLAADVERLVGAAARKTAASAVAFLPFEDNVLSLHGGAAWMVDAAYHKLKVPTWGSPGMAPIGESKHMLLRMFLAGGKAAGVWEYDPDTGEIVGACFGGGGLETMPKVAKEAKRVSAFVRDEVGHGRSFSLDTDEQLRSRAEFVRKLAKG